MCFLPKVLTVWTTRKKAPVPAKRHFVADIHSGDTLRVLLNKDGWCDVVGCLHSANEKWTFIAGWQTQLGSEPVYAGLGIRHTTTVGLCQVHCDCEHESLHSDLSFETTLMPSEGGCEGGP